MARHRYILEPWRSTLWRFQAGREWTQHWHALQNKTQYPFTFQCYTL